MGGGVEWGDKVVELKERADILLAENAVMVEQHNVVRTTRPWDSKGA